MRGMNPPSRAAMLAILALVLASILWTFRDYGITWDESVQSRYGEAALDFYLSGMRDRGFEQLFDLKYYGALFEMISSAAYRVAGTDPFATRHLLIALAGLGTVLAVMLYARCWRDPWIAVYAGLALWTLPRFHAHAFTNSKDVPFACAFAWAMLAIARCRLGSPGGALGVGAAIGLALSVRTGGLVLFVFAAAALAARARTAERGGRGRALLLQGLVISVVAWAVMVAGWPWAIESPLLHPLEALRRNLDFPLYKEVLFAGKIVASSEIPRSYLPWMLAITTPLPLLLLAAVGTGVLVRRFRGDDPAGWLVAAWIALPLGGFVISRPAIYDGIRHFLFVLPAIALLGAAGAGWIRERARPGAARHVTTALVLVLVLWPVKDLVALEPYAGTYYNALVGGVAGASGRYDTEYWASSYREAAEWINARAREAGDRPIHVLVAGNDYALECVRHFSVVNVLLQMVPGVGIPGPLPDGVDYYVAITRRNFHENFPDAPVAHTIGRAGAVFCVIKARPPG